MPAPIPFPDWTPHRTVSEERVLGHLLATTHTYEMREGRHEQARRVVKGFLESYIDWGLKFETAPDGTRLFDVAEVVNFYVWQGVQGKDSLWPRHYVTTCRRLVLDAHGRGAADGPPVLAGALPVRSFRVRFEREFDLRRLAGGARARLRLPRPIEDESLRKLDIRVQAPPQAEVMQEPARIECRLPVGATRGVKVAFDASFEALGGSLPPGELAAADRELYLRPSDLFIHVDDSVHATLAGLRVAGVPAEEAVAAIYQHCANARHCVVQYGDIDASKPLARSMGMGWFDCQILSSLFCALCRAQRIPARVVSGYPLLKALPHYHYWAQAWLPGRGWLSYDFFGWPLSMAGRDPEWSDIYAGAVDWRMKVQVFPRLFTGVSSIRFPRWWHMTSRIDGNWLEITYECASTGELIYRDRISID